MFIIIGFVIIFGGVAVGFAMAAGGYGPMNFGAIGGLFHLNEFISLGGMVIGSCVVMAPLPVLKGVFKQALARSKVHLIIRQIMRNYSNVCTNFSNLAARVV